MRNKLIELLRKIERENGCKNEYLDFFEVHGCDYNVEEILDFPDYRFIVSKFNKVYPDTPSNNIKSELKRMELDGLVTINTQVGVRNATTESNTGPDYDTNDEFTTESIILTTMGKSKWKYYLHKMIENPFTVIIAVVSLIISLISIFQ